MVGDRVDDEARGDRRAVVVEDGMSRAGSSAHFVDQQRAQLGVAVLLDDEDLVVLGDEVDDLVGEGEGAQAQRVEVDAVARRAPRAPRRIAGAVEPK